MLSSTEQDFIYHFGEMGSKWGINRTVGQIYALLFLSEDALNAEQIVERLSISRSNVSMSLKELQSWELVRIGHVAGDRRDYFTTPDDLWTIVRTLVEQRKKREIDPTLSKLRELQIQADRGAEPPDYATRRIGELRELIELLTGWYDDMNRLETERLVQLLALGSKLQGLIGKAESIIPFGRTAKSPTSSDTPKIKPMKEPR
ncbi:MAG: GbsR/MarR family transcriptional regulator [Pseudomonadota bacterium]